MANPVRDQILEQAASLLMTRGYHGFSYRDIAAEVGVKTSSIHYHFPTKEDLVMAAVEEYSAEVARNLRMIDTTLAADMQLQRYAHHFGLMRGAAGDRICLCGMLASDIESLPESVRVAVQSFFKMNEQWLAAVVERGARDGTLRGSGDAEADARALFGAFQGCVLASRLFRSSARIDDVVRAWRQAQ
ncbi:TetR/AcrR family transcriptional regulator [Chitinasiproducens palmae]|uniref:Transcriptional regulator, TetR family n=1 Tax=Chitinasiproducens palmae TaxID=1770053 RepID=A0A1H2PTD2_9BURK|nr:TetR/AcrR family transcriptional regulator [Chitinasiproducens palmae]SDV50367.1 transcriptional regulator, TetR family [Chitinasiproducens palmae]